MIAEFAVGFVIGAAVAMGLALGAFLVFTVLWLLRGTYR